METEMKNLSKNIGYKLGAILALLTMLIYAIDYKLWIDPEVVGFISLGISGIIVFAGVYSAIQSKKINENTLSFAEGFKSYFITVAIGYLIYHTTNFIILSAIDSEARLEITNIPKENIKAFFFNTIPWVFGKLSGYSLIGLIVSLAIKKDKTEY